MKAETDPLLQMPAAGAIAKCLRAMGSPETAAVFAAALALRRVLFYKNKTFDDLARAMEDWARYEAELGYLRDDAYDLATEAVQAGEDFAAARAAEAAEVLAEQRQAHGAQADDDDTDVDSRPARVSE
jgi:hypothetical protein